MSTPFRFSPGGRQRLRSLDRLLHAAYGAPESVLGNHSDPLDEAIYIILSFQTDLPRLRHTWRLLRTAFPRWRDLERAPASQVSHVLHSGGLHRQKAAAIKRLLNAVRARFGKLSLIALHDLSDVDAERILTKLPGLSWKGARCVLLYALQRHVFPVDGNTFRILQRTGVLPSSSLYRRRTLHDALQTAIVPSRRRAFHVNLVVHGQRTCLPRQPHCSECPVLSACQQRNVCP